MIILWYMYEVSCHLYCNLAVNITFVNWKWFIIQLLIWIFYLTIRLQQSCLAHQGICSLYNKKFEHLSRYLELVSFAIWCDQNFLQISSLRPCLLRDYMYIKIIFKQEMDHETFPFTCIIQFPLTVCTCTWVHY